MARISVNQVASISTSEQPVAAASYPIVDLLSLTGIQDIADETEWDEELADFCDSRWTASD
jgi:hypothetical protein